LIQSAVLPVVVIRDLESREAEEGHDVTLHCELSKPGLPVEWKRGTRVLTRGEKYQMKGIGSSYELRIFDLKPVDTGSYTCGSEDALCSASLVVHGREETTSLSHDEFVFRESFISLLNPFFFISLILDLQV